MAPITNMKADSIVSLIGENNEFVNSNNESS